MNRSFTSLRICYFGTLALSLLAVILRTVAMLCCFDATDPITGGDLGYFRDGLLPTVCYILCGVAVLFPLVCSLVIPKSDVDALKTRMQATIAPSNLVAVIPAAVCLTASVLFAVLYFVEGRADKLLPVLCLFGVLSTLFFAARAGLKLGVLVTTLLSCAVFAFCCVGIWDMYTDPRTTMNSAIKLSLQFGLIAFMLALTSEVRALLGKYAPRSGLFFHALAVFFCFNGSIPNLVAFFADKAAFNRIHFIWAGFLLAVATYETFRFVQLILSYDGNAVTEDTEAPVSDDAAIPAETETDAEEETAEESEESKIETTEAAETSSIGGNEE